MTSFKTYVTEMENAIVGIVDLSEDIIIEAGSEFKFRVEEKTPIGQPHQWKYKAPKDYAPGTLRASWKIHYSYPGETLEAVIYNDQPYALRVERGWSPQIPPQGMMRTTIQELPEIIFGITRRRKL